MTIAQLGAVNTNALNVPGVLVQIVPPTAAIIAGVPTNLLGIVGTAQWGPVNSPYIFGASGGGAFFAGGLSQYNQTYGAVMNRKYDLGTAVQIALQQGATAFAGVRVTDGTDTAANAVLATVTGESIAAPGAGYATSDTIVLTTGTGITVNSTQMVSSPAVNVSQSSTGSYAPADTITLAGGTETTNAVLTVATTQVVSATVGAAGSGGTNGTQTVTGTTGTGTKFQAVVTVSGGAITAVQYISVAGSYTVNPTTLTAEPVTGAGLTGAQLSVKMGVATTTVTTAGAYTVNPTALTQGSTSGSGTGATFTATASNFGVLTSTMTAAGIAGSGSAVPQASTSGSGTGATFNLTLSSTTITFTSLYTGSLGNNESVTFAAGSNSVPAAVTWRVTVVMKGGTPEIYDNIGGAGATLYANIANAINLGQNGVRGPSGLVVATAGSATTTPTAGTFALAGGTDGASGVTSATLIGTDGTSRAGMYALRRTGCSVVMLADADDSTKWATQLAYGNSEGSYMIGVNPAGTSIANAITNKQTAGIYAYNMKILHGDWVYWFDSTNNVQRLVSPQAFVAGELCSLSPQFSTLNQQLSGIVATQTSAANQVYSAAQLSQLAVVGIDVIANPSPGGSYFSAQFGKNSATDPTIFGDNYTRMTNFLASSFNAALGKWVGTLFSDTQAANLKGSISNYLQNLKTPPGPNLQGMIGGYAVQLPYLSAPGVETVSIQVNYLNVVSNIVANLQGGETVQIASITSSASTSAA